MSDSDRQTLEQLRKKIDRLRKDIQRHVHLYYVRDNPEKSHSEYERLKEQLKELKEKHVEQLRKDIEWHEYLYYVEDAPVISDHDYDYLMELLRDLEAKHPEWITLYTPSRRVGGQPFTKEHPEELRKVFHKIPMLSLDNAFNVEQLRDFHNRVVKNLGTEEGLEYVVELKIDGLSVSLLYENGKLVRGATRGDGKTGEDITANLKTISSIPKDISSWVRARDYPSLEVRGEVYMSRTGFKDLNRQREEEGEASFANPRNAAAGSLRLLDSRITASRPLNIWVYALGHFEGPAFTSHFEMLEKMEKLGFRTNPNTRLCQSFDDILKMIDEWQEKRTSLDYDIDGLVVKVNSIPAQNKLGSTTKHPRWAMAFKFKAEEAETVVLNIHVQVGRTGAITPVAELKPVLVSGSIVSRATLHSEGEIADLDVRVGDKVVIIKAGEIIPKVIRVLDKERKGRQAKFKMPTQCPKCDSKIEKPKGEKVWRCVNARCPAQLKERLLHFASRNAMDIDHLGEAIVDQLVEGNLVKTFSDLYTLEDKYNKVVALEHMAEKSVQNLLDEIEKSKRAGFSRFLFALGIFSVGQEVAEVLAMKYRTIEALIYAAELSKRMTIGQLFKLLKIKPVKKEIKKLLAEVLYPIDEAKKANYI